MLLLMTVLVGVSHEFGPQGSGSFNGLVLGGEDAAVVRNTIDHHVHLVGPSSATGPARDSACALTTRPGDVLGILGRGDGAQVAATVVEAVAVDVVAVQGTVLDAKKDAPQLDIAHSCVPVAIAVDSSQRTDPAKVGEVDDADRHRHSVTVGQAQLHRCAVGPDNGIGPTVPQGTHDLPSPMLHVVALTQALAGGAKATPREGAYLPDVRPVRLERLEILALPLLLVVTAAQPLCGRSAPASLEATEVLTHA